MLLLRVRTLQGRPPRAPNRKVPVQYTRFLLVHPLTVNLFLRSPASLSTPKPYIHLKGHVEESLN